MADKLFERGIDDIGIGTAFLCHDGEGNILMQKRANERKVECGTWDIGAGTLERGLTLEQNVEKEVREEYCAKILKIEFLGYREVINTGAWQNQHWLTMDYKVLVDKETVKNGEPDKISEVGWFKKDNLPAPLFSLVPDVIKKYWNKI